MIEVSGSVKLVGFERARDAALAQAMQEAAEQIRERLREQFLTEGRAYGRSWAARKDRRGHPVGIRSGRLLSSLTERSHPEHLLLGPDELGGEAAEFIIGTRVGYASFFHYGTARQPARPIFTPELLAL